MPQLTLDSWLGNVVGALRQHHLNLRLTSPLPADDRNTHGHTIAHGEVSICYGTRTSEREGREAFCEVFSRDVLAIRITHQLFVRAEIGVIPRVWRREIGRGLEVQALFHDAPETTEYTRSLEWLERVLPRVLAQGPVPAEA